MKPQCCVLVCVILPVVTLTLDRVNFQCCVLASTVCVVLPVVTLTLDRVKFQCCVLASIVCVAIPVDSDVRQGELSVLCTS